MKKFSVLNNIIYEDNHLIAVNKPAGILSQGDKTGDWSLIDYIKDFIKERDDKPGNVFLGSVHRLDRPTSGTIIFCKTSKATTRMNKLFKQKKIVKQYLAVCNGKPKSITGHLEDYLYKDTKRNRVERVKQGKKDAKLAILDYELIWNDNNISLLKLKPITGRSHQIRVQLSDIDLPILGDLKYGAKKPLANGQIALHCHSMEFIHPVSKETLCINSPVPTYYPWECAQTYFG